MKMSIAAALSGAVLACAPSAFAQQSYSLSCEGVRRDTDDGVTERNKITVLLEIDGPQNRFLLQIPGEASEWKPIFRRTRPETGGEIVTLVRETNVAGQAPFQRRTEIEAVYRTDVGSLKYDKKINNGKTRVLIETRCEPV